MIKIGISMIKNWYSNYFYFNDQHFKKPMVPFVSWSLLSLGPFFPLVPFDSIFAISRLGRLVVFISVETASTRTYHFIRVKPFGGKLPSWRYYAEVMW